MQQKCYFQKTLSITVRPYLNKKIVTTVLMYETPVKLDKLEQMGIFEAIYEKKEKY